MTVNVSHTAEIQRLFNEAAGLNNDQGNPRVKAILLRIINDLAKVIEDLDITDNEFEQLLDAIGEQPAAEAPAASGGDEITDDELTETQRLLNIRPRRTLGYRKPADMINELINGVALAN